MESGYRIESGAARSLLPAGTGDTSIDISVHFPLPTTAT